MSKRKAARKPDEAPQPNGAGESEVSAEDRARLYAKAIEKHEARPWPDFSRATRIVGDLAAVCDERGVTMYREETVIPGVAKPGAETGDEQPARKEMARMESRIDGLKTAILSALRFFGRPDVIEKPGIMREVSNLSAELRSASGERLDAIGRRLVVLLCEAHKGMAFGNIPGISMYGLPPEADAEAKLRAWNEFVREMTAATWSNDADRASAYDAALAALLDPPAPDDSERYKVNNAPAVGTPEYAAWHYEKQAHRKRERDAARAPRAEMVSRSDLSPEVQAQIEKGWEQLAKEQGERLCNDEAHHYPQWVREIAGGVKQLVATPEGLANMRQCVREHADCAIADPHCRAVRADVLTSPAAQAALLSLIYDEVCPTGERISPWNAIARDGEELHDAFQRLSDTEKERMAAHLGLRMGVKRELGELLKDDGNSELTESWLRGCLERVIAHVERPAPADGNGETTNPQAVLNGGDRNGALGETELNILRELRKRKATTAAKAVKSSVLAEAIGMTSEHVRQTAGKLVKDDYLLSARGCMGGYYLTPQGDESAKRRKHGRP